MNEIEKYILSQPEQVREGLEKLRQIVKKIVPDAEEVISYQMPAFKYHGLLLCYAGWNNHIGLYPCNSKTIVKFKEDLKDYSLSKGTIRFPLDKPLPDELIEKIVRSRINDNLAKSSK